MPECHCPENHYFIERRRIWLRGLEHWYLVLGSVAVGCGFKPLSDLELFFAEILICVKPFLFSALSVYIEKWVMDTRKPAEE
jgi:hypothetical protein